MQAQRKEAAYYAVALFLVVTVPMLAAVVAASVH
jgi:hypothetical protein